MKLKNLLLEGKNKKAELLAKKLRVDVSEIEIDFDNFIIGNKDYLVYTKSEAEKEAIEREVDLIKDAGMRLFKDSIKKEILNVKYAKPNKKKEVKKLLDYYDDNPYYVEDKLQHGYMDIEKIAKLMIKKYGVADILSGHDGKAINLGNGLNAYRNN